MSLAKAYEYLKDAQNHGYALCAFNVHNLETLKAVCEGADEESAPVILQATPKTIDFAGASYLVEMAEVASKEHSIPIILHLDHCKDLETIVDCIHKGFTSVMIDASKLELDENIKRVQKVVEIAHMVGVSVEAELGVVGSGDDSIKNQESLYTDPVVAAEFVKATNVDSLAVAIGTAHGVYKGEPKLDFNRLNAIRQKVSVPLVLHGASGVSDHDIRKCIEEGICKINIATELKIPFSNGIKEVFKNHPDESDPRNYLKKGMENMKEVVKRKIRLSGSNNRS